MLLTDSQTLTVIYYLTPPAAGWTSANTGHYTVSLRSNQVGDAVGNYAPTGTISGGFSMAFTAPAPGSQLPVTPPQYAPGTSALLAQAQTGVQANLNLFEANAEPYFATSDADTLTWDASYCIRSLTQMYEGTGNAQYLAIAQPYIDTMISERADNQGISDYYRGGILPEWVTGDDTNGNQYGWSGENGIIVAAIARWCYDVKQNSALEALYAPVVGEYLQDCARRSMSSTTSIARRPAEQGGITSRRRA